MWLGKSLATRGHSVHVFTVDHERNDTTLPHTTISPVQTATPRIGDAPRTLGRMLWSFEAQQQLGELLSRERFDVAHVHNIYNQISPSVLPVLARAGIPVVAHVHDYGMLSANHALYDAEGIDRDGSFWSVVRRRGIKHSWAASVAGASIFALHDACHIYRKHISGLIFTTEFVQHFFVSKGWRPPQSFVIPYVVDVSDEAQVPHEDHGYFLFVGQLSEEKGAHVLIEAARKTGLRVRIAGDGPARQALQGQAGAMTNVEFLGALSHERVLSYMRKATAVVVPSVWFEPFGMVAIEPQGLGTPVIVSRTGGLSELVVHGQTGLLVPPNDVDALAMAMQRLADDPREAKRLGQLGQRRFQTLYNVDEHLTRIEGVYQSLTTPVPASLRTRVVT